jgi:hypothetical protein
MRKTHYYLVLLFALLFTQNISAQCTTSATILPERYVHDTTYVGFVADTSAGTTGYTYQWNFSDGTILTGPVAEYPVTVSGGIAIFTLTTTDPTSCVSSVTNDDLGLTGRHVVLKCDSFYTPYWGSYGYQIFQLLDNSMSLGPAPWQNINGITFLLKIGVPNEYYYIGDGPAYPVSRGVRMAWGNGDTTSKVELINSDFLFGTDVPYTPYYLYGGEYRIDAVGFVKIGSASCPEIPLPPMIIRTEGPFATPLITGNTNYCVGDTLLLTASDTTAQFHNMLHYADTTGHAAIYYSDAPDAYTGEPPYEYHNIGRSMYDFEWLDRFGNVVSTDTILVINNLTMADTGMYRFHIIETTTNYHDTFFNVHVTVNPVPVATISGGSTTLCVGSTMTLSGTEPGGIWYSNMPVNVTSSGVVTGASAGPGAVVYNVSNSCGTSADTLNVTVLAAPNAGTVTGTVTGTHNVCIGSPVTLTDAVSGGMWTTVTGNASVSGGVVTGITTGADTVLYTITNDCGSAVATFPLSVNAVPVAEITGGASGICVGNTMTLTGTAAGGTWYSNLLVSVTSGGVVIGLAEGPGAVIYSISNSCGSSADTLFVTVAPPANAGVLTGTGSICVGASTTITPDATGGVWTTATGNASVAGGVISGVTAGADTVLYTVANSCGTDVATLPVIVDAIPNADTITGAGSLCMSGAISLTAGAGGGTWSATNGSVTVSASGIVTPITPGTDTITYIVSNSCGADTATATITVGALPVAGSIFGIDTVCVGASAILTTSGVGGIWSSTDSAVIDITGAGLINAVAPGNATIIYSVTTACGTATASRSIHVLSAAECGVGVAGVSGLKQMTIYPNPTSGLFNIHLPVSQAGAIITLTDVSGRVVKVVNVLSNTTVVQVTLSDVPAGSYLVKVEADGVVYHDKILKW